MNVSLPVYTKAKVLVVGDVMLDSYYSGQATRISPEAPVPVVRVQNKESRPGGAANVALNIASLGGKCTIVGYVGIDQEGGELTTQLMKRNVTCRFVQVPDYPTITKLRVLSRHQQLIRLDFEQNFNDIDPKDLISMVSDCIDDCDVVILSDYGKGALRHAQEIIKLAKSKGKTVLVDPKGTDFERYSDADVITPNMAEFEAVVGQVCDEESLKNKAYQLMDKFGVHNLLVTRSEKGMSLFCQNKTEMHLPTNAREVYDVTGAGDTVIAVLAATLSTGANLQESCYMSNVAAGIVVGKLGTSTVSSKELAKAIGCESPSKSGIVTEDELLELISQAHLHGEKVVMTNGCFDIIHSGHCQYLNQAKELGDRLIVAVNTDESVSKLKGPTRPVNLLQNRMDVLAALGSVDWVVPFSEETPQRLIAKLLPDILVKGGDYKIEEIAGAKDVMKNGGEVKVLSFKEGCSTTNLINKIKSSDK